MRRELVVVDGEAGRWKGFWERIQRSEGIDELVARRGGLPFHYRVRVIERDDPEPEQFDLGPDCIVCVDQSAGLGAISAIVSSVDLAVPVIYGMSVVNVEQADEALRHGAMDVWIFDENEVKNGLFALRLERWLERWQVEKLGQEARNQFLTVVEQTAIGVAEIDSVTGRFLWVNNCYARMLGLTVSELMSTDFMTITHPDDLAEDLRRMESLRRGECTSFSMEKRYFTREGRIVWVHLTVSRLWHAGQAPTRHLALVVDITEGKRTQAELQTNAALLASVVNSTPDLLFARDERSRVILCNEAFSTALGKKTEQLLGHADLGEGWLSAVLEEVASKRLTGSHDSSNVETNTTPYYALDVRVLVGNEVRFFDVCEVPLRDLSGEKTGLLDMLRDTTERKRAEMALHASQQQLTALANSLPGTIYQCLNDRQWTLQFVSEGSTRLTGYTPEELIDRRVITYLDLIIPEDRDMVWEQVQRGIAEKGLFSVEYRIATKKGDVRWVLDQGASVVDEEGKSVALLGYLSDITERKQLELRLQQSQKMESIGRLAGGIAHDFNNMLTVILGRVDLAMARTDCTCDLRDDLVDIGRAAQHSADLTKQLLAFARKQMVSPRVVNLNLVVQELLVTLRRLIGEDVACVWRPDENLRPVKIDPSQVNQILANLCANARDAMRNGGTIEITTENITLTNWTGRPAIDLNMGDYVKLTVSDTGQGIPEEILKYVFEPFFTTKPAGQGVGLGLATVYGIAKQNGGTVTVESEVGKGSAFSVYLPVCSLDAARQSAGDVGTKGSAVRGGKETVLVVEDEPSLLSTICVILESFGYAVLAASSPQKGIELALKHPGKIDLLLTDVVMPQMNGRQLATKIKARRPSIRTLFMSGYSADFVQYRGVDGENVHFLQKPFSYLDLSEKVRRALDAASSEPVS